MLRSAEASRAYGRKVTAVPRRILLFTFCLSVSLSLCLLHADVSPALLSDLRSESYETRRAASSKLLSDNSVTLDDIRKLYAAATTPEQRARILDAARHHFVRRLRDDRPGAAGQGSLGLTVLPGLSAEQLPEVGRSAIRVGVTYPGFPAYAALQPGDLVLAINGRSLPPNADEVTGRQKFIELVQANQPGAEVKVEIYRDGQVTTVTVQLASLTALTSLYEVGAQTLRGQFETRWLEFRRELVASNEPPAEPLKITVNRSAPEPLPPPPHVNQELEDDAAE